MTDYPRELGACIDLAYALRKKRMEFERSIKDKLEKFKADEDAIEEHIIQGFSKSEIDGAKGKKATASISRSTVCSVKDWDKFFAWVAKKKAWEMVQRRVNNGAYRERLDAKVVVPGTEPFTKVSLSLTKR